MLEIERLRFRYSRHGPMVLDGVDLELKDGEIGILLGKERLRQDYALSDHPWNPEA